MFKLSKPLGRSYNSSPEDIYNTKSALNQMGYYKINPAAGLNGWVDTQLFNSIENFQKDNQLTVDAVIKPSGPTESVINNQLSAASYGYQLGDDGMRPAYATSPKQPMPHCGRPPQPGENPRPAYKTMPKDPPNWPHCGRPPQPGDGKLS